MKLSIVIPAYNEEKTLEQIVQKVLDVKFKDVIKEIIIVNDCSKDKTPEIADKLSKNNKSIKVIHHDVNKGKSQSVRDGMLKSSGDYVVVQDADLEYDPNNLIDFVDIIKKSDFDVVYGDRFGRKNSRGYLQNYLGNKFLSFVSNLFTYPRIKVTIPDMEVCYKMIRGNISRAVAKHIESRSNFGIEPEITARLSKYRKENNEYLKFGIVAIDYYPRTSKEGKHMKAFRDGFKALKEIIKFNV